jgi:protein-disulfide isomerase
VANDDVARLTLPVSARDHAQGPADAPVTLVEYGDYECPHCGRAYPIVKEVQRRLGSRLRLVFRNFPLSESHPHAQHAAEAAEGAGAHGRFWEMHDMLFEHQQALLDRHLVSYAAAIGLDAAAFADELRAHTYKGRVREDFLSGVRSGVNGTPTFFINGVRFDDSWDPDTLTAALTAAARTTTKMKVD